MTDARAVIGKLNTHLRFAGTYGDREIAAANFFQGVHRIRNDLQKTVKQLARTGPDPRPGRRPLQLNAYVMQFVDAAQMESVLEQWFYFHGSDLQRGFLGETLHILDEGIGSLRILANLSCQGAAARFAMRARGDASRLLPDNGHGFPNL